MTVTDGKLEEKLKTQPKPAQWFGVRHEQYVLLLTAFVIIYSMRTSFSVAVIAMISNDPPNDRIPTYPEWDSEKNVMLSSFFWGYACLQLVGAQLAKRYGPKLLLGISLFVTSLFTILLPLMGDTFGYRGVIASRAIQGLVQGFLYPCVHNLLGVWAPIGDRAKIGTFVYSGSAVGTVIALPLAGVISASSAGWTVIFYICGGLGLAWTAAWVILGSNSPSTNKRLSGEERRYIEDGINVDREKLVPTPWLSIFTSLPFIAIIIVDIGNGWGFFTLLTELPSYMHSVLKFDIDSNSILSALPYLASMLFGYAMSPIADMLITKKIVSRTTSRKIFTSIGILLPALALFLLNFVGSTQKAITILLLVLAVGLNSAALSGHIINHMDLSPVHAGTLMGITNTISNAISIVTPLIVDTIKSATGYEETNKSLWNIVFSIAGVIYVVGGTFYIFAGSAEVQLWNETVNTPKFNTQSKEEEAKQVVIS